MTRTKHIVPEGAPLTTRGARRLLKLARFLRERVPKEKFDFTVIMQQGENPPLEALKLGAHKCGTVGCAIGWMPAVWPKQLEWDTFQCVVIRDDEQNIGADFRVAREWFRISDTDADYLFMPNWGHSVGRDATPKAVADHIRRFVKARYEGKAQLDYGVAK